MPITRLRPRRAMRRAIRRTRPRSMSAPRRGAQGEPMPAALYRLDRQKPLGSQLLGLLDRIGTDFASVRALTATMAQQQDDEDGTLSTRTDASSGVATLAASHRIQADEPVDVQWSGGARQGALVSA